MRAGIFVLMFIAVAHADPVHLYTPDVSGGKFTAGRCGTKIQNELSQLLGAIKEIGKINDAQMSLRTPSGMQPASRVLGTTPWQYGFWDLSDVSTLVVSIDNECKSTTCPVQVWLIHRANQTNRLDACYERWTGRAIQKQQ